MISSAAFRPMNFRITERNLDNIGCIMDIRKETFTGEGVSWTDKPLDYFIHTIDHTKIAKFFEGTLVQEVRETPAACIIMLVYFICVIV